MDVSVEVMYYPEARAWQSHLVQSQEETVSGQRQGVGYWAFSAMGVYNPNK